MGPEPFIKMTVISLPHGRRTPHARIHTAMSIDNFMLDSTIWMNVTDVESNGGRQTQKGQAT